jgi:hypothetical protein
MGGDTPHLGLVLKKGSLASYSIDNRPMVSNDRGCFVVHPQGLTLEPGESTTLSWVLFWHNGWDDFFSKALDVPGFVKMNAMDYVIVEGQKLHVQAESKEALADAEVRVNDALVLSEKHGGHLATEFQTNHPGEHTVTLEARGRRTHLKAFVVPQPADLVRQRVNFIIRHQQVNTEGPLYGAYVVYDNEEGKQIYREMDPFRADNLNAGRERVGMGILLATYLQTYGDEDNTQVKESLLRYYDFVCRELWDEDGTVYNDVGRLATGRIFNYPWVAGLHLEMYGVTGNQVCLKRFVDTIKSFYLLEDTLHAICIPVLRGLQTLEAAHMNVEYEELLDLFTSHAQEIVNMGNAYRKTEVNYEQGNVVGPAVFMLEMYLATGVDRYLENARQHMGLLELFNGCQPDYHLNDIPIRHWDGFWFGKLRRYGDVFPHHWSALTAMAFHRYWQATGEEQYRKRARQILMANMCLFKPDGRASCAYIYPLSVNDLPGQYYDPYANDQDWALVHWLLLADANSRPKGK